MGSLRTALMSYLKRFGKLPVPPPCCSDSMAYVRLPRGIILLFGTNCATHQLQQFISADVFTHVCRVVCFLAIRTRNYVVVAETPLSRPFCPLVTISRDRKSKTDFRAGPLHWFEWKTGFRPGDRQAELGGGGSDEKSLEIGTAK